MLRLGLWFYGRDTKPASPTHQRAARSQLRIVARATLVQPFRRVPLPKLPQRCLTRPGRVRHPLSQSSNAVGQCGPECAAGCHFEQGTAVREWAAKCRRPPEPCQRLTAPTRSEGRDRTRRLPKVGGECAVRETGVKPSLSFVSWISIWHLT